MGALTYSEMGERLASAVAADHEGELVNAPPAQHLVFDPYDYAFQEDPYPTYARLRAEQPLHHAPGIGGDADRDFWVLSRHGDVLAALRDDTTCSNAMGVSIDRSAWGPDAHKVMSFLAMDPPRQQRLRSAGVEGVHSPPGG